MEPDNERVDAAVLALMYLTLHEECRAWKGFDWESTTRLYEKGLIENPANKSKSVVLTPQGMVEAARLFKELLAKR
jgi:hypothetical protein